jgi:type IV pilus assembly protein PilY1
MKSKSLTKSWLATALVAIQVWGPFVSQAKAALLPIGDSPIVASSAVSPNLMLTLSVEWPTGVVAAYNDNTNTTTGYECPGRTTDSSVGNVGRCYFEAREYLGYFDPKKCYLYNATTEYFYPSSAASGTYSHACSAKWSGNYLNWATSHSLDVFRFTMTGGDRIIDTATETVIEKSFHSGTGGHGQFPIKRVRDTVDSSGSPTIPAVAPNTISPYSYSKLYARVTNGTTAISKAAVANSLGRVVQISDKSDFSTNLATFLVRVKVCDGTVGRESNCTQYGSSWKPTGLIQNNSDRMRFGVMGYLNDSAQTRPGGVLRSPLKFVGRNNIIPNGTPTVNSNPEINTDGTHVSNPDPTYASASGVTNSGVIHYLNQFGKTSQSYKSYDTLSEMVYETSRYVRNLPASPQYTAGMTTAMADGFPVVTNWDSRDQTQVQNRAIQYSCQKTFFVGIADTNTWCDVTVPGNTLVPDSCGAKNSVYSGTDSQINVATLGNAMGTAEGSGNLGTTFANTGRDNTYHAASIAYWANSTDMLPDDASKPWTKGNQTAQTYWVDVRETGSDGPTGTQMWLAAKYGGYNNIGATPGTLKTAPTATVDFDKDSDGTPDNYYTGERPDKMNAALKSVFQNVLDVTYAGAGASVSTQSLSAGGSSYQVRYSSLDWSGDVMGNTLTLSVDDPSTAADEGGVPTETNVWRASTKLNTLAGGTGWDTARKIVTFNGTVGVPFRPSGSPGLTSTQLGYLGSTSAEQTNLIEYTRGKRTLEGTTFRTRTNLLGDIINSKATYVGAPSERYNDATHAGFTTFRTGAAVANRTPMIYVGANDGMMHAFNASTSDSDGGNEKFAYIPSLVLSGPSSPATPSVDGLAARANLGNFTHKYYADQTPMVRSVNFAHTGVAPAGGFTGGTPDWRTLLVAGLNKGGRGYYAMDVTNPAQWTSETAVAGKVLWEFTDPDMGYSYGRPVIVYTKKHGWVVILTSGYNNTRGAAANQGKGFLYVLNAQTGALLDKIGPGAGGATTPSGLAQVNAFVPDFREMTVDYVYGGDLLGNLWRFDLTQAAGSAGTYPAPVKFAVVTDGTNPQPVTTEPKVEIDRDRVSRWVFVGTGQLMSDADVPSTQVQTIYAFRDGTVSAANTAGTFPLDRSALAALTNPVAGVTPTTNGWYMDLTLNPGASGSPAERVVNTPTTNEGFIGWVTQKPTDDPCAPGVVSYAYLLEYASGKTRLIDSGGGWVASYQAPSTSGFFLEWVFLRSGEGRMRGIVSTSSGSTVGGVPAGGLLPPPQKLGITPGAPKRLQWREVVR